MKYIITLLGNYALLLLFVVFIETICTMGIAFSFERYNWFAWFVQALILFVTFYGAYSITEDQIDREKF